MLEASSEEFERVGIGSALSFGLAHQALALLELPTRDMRTLGARRTSLDPSLL